MEFNLDELPINTLLQNMNDNDKTVPAIVELAIPQIIPVVEKVVDTINSHGKVIYMGSGTSGRLGILDASEIPPTFGASQDLFKGLIAGGTKAIQLPVEDAEDNEEAGSMEVGQKVSKNDILITLSASGRTPYVIGGVNKAREIGAKTAGIVACLDSQIANKVNYPIELDVGEEFIKGSSRLKAGTAQKLVLNMISTISMIKLGRVYGKHMVDVQASNQKLRDRTIEIVKEIAEVSQTNAKQSLDLSEGDLKIAALIAKYGLSKPDALQCLKEANQNLREAMSIVEERTYG